MFLLSIIAALSFVPSPLLASRPPPTPPCGVAIPQGNGFSVWHSCPDLRH